jgi:hypothetical protein
MAETNWLDSLSQARSRIGRLTTHHYNGDRVPNSPPEDVAVAQPNRFTLKRQGGRWR